MADMKQRLIATTANLGEEITFERITAGCIRMRAKRITSEEKIERTEGKLEEQEKQERFIVDLLDKIRAQLEEAKNTDKDEMNSALVHEKEQVRDNKERSEELGMR